MAESEEFAALLSHVRRCIGRLSDEILSGNIDIQPYRIGTQSPCPYCEYKSVCRFDAALNRYRQIQPAPREQILQQVSREAGHA